MCVSATRDSRPPTTVPMSVVLRSNAVARSTNLARRTNQMLKTAVVRIISKIVTDSGIARDTARFTRTDVSAGATVFETAGEIKAGAGAAVCPGRVAAAADSIGKACLGAAFVVEDTRGSIRSTAANSVRANLRGDANHTAVAAVLGVAAGIDTTKFATDLAGAIEAGAAAAIARAALTVVLAGLLILDAGGFLLRAGAGVQIQRLAIGAAWNTLNGALLRTVRAGAEPLGDIGTGGAAGTAALATSRLRGGAIQ